MLKSSVTKYFQYRISIWPNESSQNLPVPRVGSNLVFSLHSNSDNNLAFDVDDYILRQERSRQWQIKTDSARVGFQLEQWPTVHPQDVVSRPDNHFKTGNLGLLQSSRTAADFNVHGQKQLKQLPWNSNFWKKWIPSQVTAGNNCFFALM